MPTVVASDSPSDVPSTSASPTFPAECSAHQECAALQLTGLCCPTTDDVMVRDQVTRRTYYERDPLLTFSFSFPLRS